MQAFTSGSGRGLFGRGGRLPPDFLRVLRLALRTDLLNISTLVGLFLELFSKKIGGEYRIYEPPIEDILKSLVRSIY